MWKVLIILIILEDVQLRTVIYTRYEEKNHKIKRIKHKIKPFSNVNQRKIQILYLQELPF